MRKEWGLLATLMCSTSAYAVSVPQPGAADTHMRTEPYDPNNLTEISIGLNRTALIEINHRECIKWDLTGSKDGPVGTPKKEEMGSEPMYHTMPIWGQKEGTTNLNIVSVDCDDHKVEYSYVILIHVKELPKANEKDDTTTLLRYTYAAQEKQATAAVAAVSWKQKREQAEHDKVVARLAVEPFYQDPKLGRNFKYIAIGDSSITPVVNGGTSDNFATTAFRFPGNMEVPAILMADGAPTEKMCSLLEKPSKALLHSPEHTVTVQAKDDWAIVYQTSAHWRFKMGNGAAGKVADVFSCGYDPIGNNPGTGTPSLDVVRMMRQVAAAPK